MAPVATIGRSSACLTTFHVASRATAPSGATGRCRIGGLRITGLGFYDPSMNTSTNALRIGNAAGFWGDNTDAPRRLAEVADLDYLTLEYLAELTLSILAHLKSKNPEAGYVTECPNVVRSLVPAFRANPKLKLVTNGGGMNPAACAKAVSSVLAEEGLGDVRVAACSGDDVLADMSEHIAAGQRFVHFETGQDLIEGETPRVNIASANAYLGAAGIVEALADGAQIILTGRIADASLVTGPAIHEFGWAWNDWERLGGATVAGHLIECGAQATGGIYSNWSEQLDLSNIGYPIAELHKDGTSVITKPLGTGGCVNRQTVAEQLVYEIGDPARYMTPDVVADFTNVTLEQHGQDRVFVAGGTGTPAPETYKVSMAYKDGYAGSGMIVIAGGDAVGKARQSGELIRQRVREAGFELAHYNYELLGAGGSLSGMNLGEGTPWEVVLRVAARDPNRAAIDRMLRELAPLVTSGPPGVTGYTGARSKSHPVLAYWPSTIHRDRMRHTVRVQSAMEWTRADGV